MKSDNVHLFEGGIQIYVIKVLSAMCIYVFILEPLLYEYWVKKIDYQYLEHAASVFKLLIFVLAAVLGWFHGRSKRTLFSFLGSISLFIACYTLWLGSFKYKLWPAENSIWHKYISLLLAFPFISTIKFLIQNWDAINVYHLIINTWNINKLDSVRQDHSILQLNTDQSLGDLRDKTKEEIVKLDVLRYYPLAEGILDSIATLNPSKAFSIGINGSWGSGKSSLISILVDKLIPDYNSQMRERFNKFREIRVISFSPWLYPDEESLISNFFACWREEMNDPVLKMLFDDYGSLLHDIKIGGMIVKLQNLFASNKSLEALKEKIEEHLYRQTNYKYVVIIDDLDRLDKDEILEVARLSRVLGDFPNTFYLLSYDRGYIDKMLEGTQQKKSKESHEKNESYFDKIIQLEFKIPQATEDRLATFLEKLILDNKDFILGSDPRNSEEEIFIQLGNIGSLRVYQHFIPTIRDIKRFLNGFLLRFNALRKGGHDVSFREILLLEMLFYRYKNFYEGFYIKRLENVNHGALTQVNITLISPFNELKSEQTAEIQAVLKEIFSDRDSLNRQLRLIDSYYSYFSTNGFTQADLDRFIRAASQRPRIARELVLDGFAGELLVGFANEVIYKNLTPIEQDLIFSLSDALNKQIKETLDMIFIIMNENNLYLSKEQLVEVNTCYTALWHKLNNLSKEANTIIIARIQECQTIIRGFSLPNDILDLKKDVSTIIRTKDISKEGGASASDDTIYDKVLDLDEGPYDLSFMPPSLKHWRFGVSLSTDNNFPVAYGLRTFHKHPLFHIGKRHQPDEENILITFYPGEEEKPRASLPEVKFVARDKITFRIGRSNGNVFLELYHGVTKIQTINNLDLTQFNKCRIQVWADNENDGAACEIELEIAKVVKGIASH